MIRVIALDLDDTFIAPDKRIPPENVAAVRAATQAGVRVVIATARGWLRTEPFYKEMQLTTPAIVSSGSALVDGKAGRQLWVHQLPMDAAREVAAFCDEERIALRVYVGQEIWNNLDYDPLRKSNITTEIRKSCLAEELVEAPFQMYTKGEREAKVLRERFGTGGDGYDIHTVTYLDGIPEVSIMHPAATKGRALEALCTSWNIPREDVMAIGDSANDLSMIGWAGMGVAMSWSPEDVQQRANFVPTPGNPAGVAEAIYKVLRDNDHESNKKTPHVSSF